MGVGVLKNSCSIEPSFFIPAHITTPTFPFLPTLPLSITVHLINILIGHSFQHPPPSPPPPQHQRESLFKRSKPRILNILNRLQISPSSQFENDVIMETDESFIPTTENMNLLQAFVERVSGVVWCSVLWCGVECCGVVWFSVVCCGVVWWLL